MTLNTFKYSQGLSSVLFDVERKNCLLIKLVSTRDGAPCWSFSSFQHLLYRRAEGDYSPRCPTPERVCYTTQERDTRERAAVLETRQKVQAHHIS